ncbi:MAG: hypothetical protein V2B15_11610 [Bacteroidota bacterium]
MPKYYRYKAFGLVINSELNLPELNSSSEYQTDVTIHIGQVPKKLPHITGKGVLYEAAPGDFLFRLDKVAAFRVQSGSAITIEPYNNNPEEIRIFLLGSVFGALFHQRGLLVLHGSAIEFGDVSILFTGKSAMGKSSLAAAFELRGCPIITDDLAVLKPEESGYSIYPGIPYIKLWKDVADNLYPDNSFTKTRSGLEKYSKPVQRTPSTEKKQLSKIIVLSTSNQSDFRMNKMEGMEKFNSIRVNTYRLRFINDLGLNEKHFQLISQLSKEIDLFGIQRPESPLLLSETVEFILDNVLYE